MEIKDSYSDIFADKQTVMFIFAHPDDAEVYAGGTIARLTKEGKNVYVVKVTNGNKGSRDNEISLNELEQLREQEDQNSMTLLGIKPENSLSLEIDDGAVEDSIDNIGKVAYLIRKYKPDIVITHNPEDVVIRFAKDENWINHRDHMNCGKIATYGVYPYSRDLNFFPEHLAEEGVASHTVSELMYVDYYGHSDEVFIDITDHVQTKKDALAAHKSQFTQERADSMVDYFTSGLEEGRNYERFRYVIAD